MKNNKKSKYGEEKGVIFLVCTVFFAMSIAGIFFDKTDWGGYMSGVEFMIIFFGGCWLLSVSMMVEDWINRREK